MINKSVYYNLLRLCYYCTKPLTGILRFSIFSKLTHGFFLYFKRPEWLVSPGVEMDPIKQFSFVPMSNSTLSEEDIKLCDRLIKSFSLACSKSDEHTSMRKSPWNDIAQKHHGALLEPLNKGDAPALARVLANMFQEKFLWGMASSLDGLYPGHSPFIRMQIVERIFSLAESLALVRTEMPCHAEGYGSPEELPQLVSKLEQTIGISLNFPEVGGAYGLLIGNSVITLEAPEHIHVALRIKEAVLQHLEPKELKVVEIGAGFGGTCYWLNRLMPDIASYTIIDLPQVNVLQGYFLAKVYGPEKVRLFGEKQQSTTKFTILPTQAKVQVGDFDLLINEDSMPEIPESVVKDYLSWAKSGLTGIFFSYNQEAHEIQTLVAKAVAETGGYARLSRHLSWLRRGYVEEVYACAGTKES
jgi:hypothetical protein